MTAVPPRPARGGRLLAVVLGLAASALGVLLTLYRVRFVGGLHLEPRLAPGAFSSALAAADPRWLALSAACNFATLGARALEVWALAGGAPFRAAWHASATALLAQTVLPARLGEAVRALTLARTARLPFGVAAGVVLLGRVLDLPALVVATAVPALALPLPDGGALSRRGLVEAAGGGLLVALVAIAAILVLWRRRAVLTREAATSGGRFRRLAAQVVTGLGALGSRGRLALALVGAVGVPCLVMVSLWAAFRAFALPFGLEAAPLVCAVVFLAIALPSAPSSLGVYHAALAWVLEALGATAGAATALAVATHAISAATWCLVGGLSLALVGWPRGESAR